MTAPAAGGRTMALAARLALAALIVAALTTLAAFALAS
jgi:hypothetical protein